MRLMKIGYHSSHEQYAPRELLEHVQHAERSGFDVAMCSDHLFPWSKSQGHSGFAWSWLGAAMQATKLTFGVVNAPGWRYHPVIIAQAAATLAQMFPERFWIAVGSGEALNEHITGEAWAPKPERNARLRECVEIMRRLWRGETVTHRGLVTAVEARVYSLPEKPPAIIAAALSTETAEWAGEWADGLITTGRPVDEMRAMIDAFRRGGGEGKPVLVQAKHAWAATDQEAMKHALDQWAPNVFPSAIGSDLLMPEHYEALVPLVTEERIRQSVIVSSDPAVHIDAIRRYPELGVSALYIHNVGKNQSEFIDAFGSTVLPQVRSSR